MVKMVFCVRKRKDISADDFFDYWLNQHGPLVKSFSEPLQIKRYVQSHTRHQDFGTLTVDQRGMKPGYDGLAELWWDDLESIQTAMSTEAGREANAALAADEARFIDLGESTIFFTEEHIILTSED